MHQEATETYRQRHSQLLYDAILYYDALALRCPMTLRPLYFFYANHDHSHNHSLLYTNINRPVLTNNNHIDFITMHSNAALAFNS